MYIYTCQIKQQNYLIYGLTHQLTAPSCFLLTQVYKISPLKQQLNEGAGGGEGPVGGEEHLDEVGLPFLRVQ